LFVVRQRALRRADHLSRGFLLSAISATVTVYTDNEWVREEVKLKRKEIKKAERKKENK